MTRDKTDLIILENAGVRRDNRWLVRGIDLRIREGEIVTIIGPNGAGKSTTGKLAVGTIHANEGRVQCQASLRGAVHRIESVNGFVACQLHDCGGSQVSIFMLCTQCEHAHEFTDTGIDNRLQSPGNNRGFQAAHKIIEITGLCADCQTSQTAAQKH